LADPGDFLARWSRLKRKASAEAREEAPPPPATAEPMPAEPPAPGEAAAAPPAVKDELPPIDTLGKDSDYTPFMQADVPDGLRNQALRKLWQSDPVFANLDGLLEYGEDFAAAFSLGGAVATVYRVLEGMPRAATAERPQPAADVQPAGAAPPSAGLAGAPDTQVQPSASLSELQENIELGRDAELD
jgi:hypothetical protein